MRLAFSVAINVNADVLLVDEILAVGDTAFQAKCYDKLRSIKAAGVTVVIVSHDLKAIENFCDRSIWIDKGYICADGRPEDVHSKYLESTETRGAVSRAGNDAKRWGSREIEITDVVLRNGSGATNEAPIRTGDDILIEYGYRVPGKAPLDVETGISITRNDGVLIYGTNTAIEGVGVKVARGGGRVRITIEKNSLLGGTYFLGVAFHKRDGYPYDYWSECRLFYVLSGTSDVGTARQFHTWKFE